MLKIRKQEKKKLGFGILQPTHRRNQNETNRKVDIIILPKNETRKHTLVLSHEVPQPDSVPSQDSTAFAHAVLKTPGVIQVLRKRSVGVNHSWGSALCFATTTEYRRCPH